jgi:signal recognition particle subunit SRP54
VPVFALFFFGDFRKMLETVTKGFRNAKLLLQGKAELSESNIESALAEVRSSLLEADVEFGVVKTFLARVKEQAIGKEVALRSSGAKKISAADHFIGICSQELERLMGPVDTAIKLSQPIGTIMMVGLQGSGKTTTTGKLALFLQKKKWRPLLVAADIYRPAAVEQLKVLGKSLGVPVYSEEGVAPPELCKRALQKAKEHQCNVVIFDTAGRLAIDETLMQELEAIKTNVKPDSIYLVVDAMIGQDAVRTAAEFNRRLSIDGFILTKLDGDARGGAALSIKEVTGKPIKFLGMGEKLQNLEEFRPQGLASRILGMGDIVSLVKDFEEHVDHEKAEKDAARMLKGQFTLTDFIEQLAVIKKMGPLQDLMAKMPGMSEMIPPGTQVDDRELVKIEAMVHSMTLAERRRPDLIEKQKNRRKRIALGSGRKEAEVDSLLKRFAMMKQMFSMIGTNPGLLGRLPGFKQIGQMAKLSKAMGGGGMGLPPGFGAGMPAGFGHAPSFGMSAASAGGARATKDKKDKRKREKAARKKNKKR